MVRSDARAVYESLVREQAGALYRFAYRLVGEAAAAEDLVQETYLHAWRSIGSLRDPAAGGSWLVTILRRRWGRSLRDRSRRPRTSSDLDVDATASPLPGPDLALFSRREDLQAALDQLDPRLKEPLLLVFLSGLSCRETAECLTVPLGTVLSRLHRARAELRRQLRERIDGENKGRGDSTAVAGGAS